MKKTILLFLTLVLVFFICACTGNGSKDKYVEVDSLENLTAQVGFEITIPATARNISYYIENDIIAEINFAYNGIMYKYRASKVTAGTGLHGKTGKLENETRMQIGDRADIIMYTALEGARIATWSKDGTNYSIYTEKNASDDTIIELCDLLVS